jgi:glycosyltransferase involved in cell wall biosynthesis
LVLFAGRFDRNKDVPTLAAALARLLSDEPRAHASCCGEGELHGWFRGEIDRLGLGARCHTPGWVTHLWGLMKRADAFVSTSRVEGNPNAVLEAMACGCPLVLSDIPEHRELADASTALFFPPSSPVAAAARLREALADRAASRHRAELAAARVGGRSIARMAAAYAGLYASLLRTSPTTRAK